MLFLLFGSSAGGKTVALNLLRGQVNGMAVHDFDEIGVPPSADLMWRQRSNEVWLRRALDYQAHGTDLMVAGQTPLGELLATPSAPYLEAISACLIDCDDRTRVERLKKRGSQWWTGSSGDLSDYLEWAEWMRRHAADPRWRPDVIARPDGPPAMRWSRWSTWRAGDPRWRVQVVDTSNLAIASVAAALSDWINDERTLLRLGGHPLTGAAISDSD